MADRPNPPDNTPPSPEPNPAPYIKLDQFLKVVGVAATGGQAKLLIQEGYVLVNEAVETRRGRKLRTGDRVSIDDEGWEVQL
ncbi:MAG: RNA-binding S4 domain-containing protein [Prochlorothrix sp.]|nr:RNA-binding S4 domain-containing protein [Prochlorothrix sp.]